MLFHEYATGDHPLGLNTEVCLCNPLLLIRTFSPFQRQRKCPPDVRSSQRVLCVGNRKLGICSLNRHEFCSFYLNSYTNAAYFFKPFQEKFGIWKLKVKSSVPRVEKRTFHHF